MNNVQESKLKRNNVMITVFTENKSSVDLNPALARHCARFTDVNQAIAKLHPIQAPNSKGITEGKNLLKDDVAEKGLIIAGALSSMAEEQGNTELSVRMDLDISDFKRASVADFNKLCAEITTQAELAGSQLSEYGVTPEDVASFKALSDEFRVAAIKPREARVKKSTATSTLDELFTEADQIIEYHFDKLMLQFKLSNPEFYKDYLSASILESHGSRQSPQPPPVATASPS